MKDRENLFELSTIFRYDNRKKVEGSNNGGQHWSDKDIFGSRVLFSETSKPPSLAIDDLQRSDDDVYKCRVDFKIAQTSITRVRLTVIGKLYCLTLIGMGLPFL